MFCPQLLSFAKHPSESLIINEFKTSANSTCRSRFINVVVHSAAHFEHAMVLSQLASRVTIFEVDRISGFWLCQPPWPDRLSIRRMVSLTSTRHRSITEIK